MHLSVVVNSGHKASKGGEASTKKARIEVKGMFILIELKSVS